jgi:serine/threonine protein kinase
MSAWPPTPPAIGRYALGRTLGKGSFSLVKEAEDTETHLRVAIKLIPRTNIMSPSGLERFEREVRVMIKMDHPGVTKVYDFLADTDFLFLVMELVTGDTLLSQLPLSGALPEDIVRRIFQQLLATVAYIHDQGIAHRDLKLENVLVGSDLNIKIIDFGFSRAAQSPGELFGTSCGSPAYAAPEILEARPYDGRMADMWSMGVMLYALVVGALPWRGTHQQVVYEQIAAADFQVPPTVGLICTDLIKKLMTLNPAARLTAREARNHPWLEGVEAKWESSNGVAPSLTERTFLRRLTSSSEPAQSVMPHQTLSVGRISVSNQKRFGPPRGVSVDGKMKRFAVGSFALAVAAGGGA